MLDTPVSGSVPQVKSGTLTIMVGGDHDAYARIEPVLRVLEPPDEAWFDIGLMHKDIRLARQSGAEHETPLPTAGVADEILTKAEQLGYSHRDIATVHDLLAHLPNNATPVTP